MVGLLAAIHPWVPHLFTWPTWTGPVGWWWSSAPGGGYGFTSSIGIGSVLAVGIYLRHANCSVTHCPLPGRPVHGTSFIGCRLHHPHTQGRITAEDLARAARDGHQPD